MLDRSAETTRPLIDDVADMPAPEGKERQAKAFVASMNTLLPMLEKLVDNLRDGDEAQLRDLTQDMQEETVNARGLARELGIDACIPNSGTS